MRESKFRAWNQQNKKMSQPFGIFDIHTEDCNTYAHQDNAPAFELGFIGEKIIQFTGLKDKNDVEIYEGDIVKGIVPDSEIDMIFEKGVISFKEGGFDIYGINKVFGDKNYYIGSLISCTLNRSIEVIGNICRNTESDDVVHAKSAQGEGQ